MIKVNNNMQDNHVRRFVTALLTGVMLLMCATSAAAHKVTVFAWVEGDTVHTESKFSGGKVVQGGKIEVLDAQGGRLLEGRTDDGGAFSFKVPAAGDLTVVLTAGMGHRNTWRLSAAELGGVGPDGSKLPEHQVATAALQAPANPAPAQIAPGLTAAQVDAIVARQLEEKLAPLNRMVAAAGAERGPTLGDIIGGIGYIIGLVGLGAYVRYRKAQHDS
jgi:nickel transport protein